MLQRDKLEKEIINQLEPHSKICFGPIVGDFGWEISYLAEFIKKYKENNPNKKIYVITRENRKELYTGSLIDDIITFNIEGDYKSYTPRTHGVFEVIPKNVNSPKSIDIDKKFKSIIARAKEKYDDVYFFNFRFITSKMYPEFDLTKFDYKYNVHEDNYKSIEKYLDKDKIIVTLFSRQRVDLLHRNLGQDKWEYLFERLAKLENYFFFISGSSPAYFKAKSHHKNMINLEDLENNFGKQTTLGMTIEAVRNSDFVFGPQTAGILLANGLKIPSLYFGNDIEIVSKNFNPFNVRSENIPVKIKHTTGEYDIHPDHLLKCLIDFKINEKNNGIKDTINYILELNKELQDTVDGYIPPLSMMTDVERIKRIKEMNRTHNLSIIK